MWLEKRERKEGNEVPSFALIFCLFSPSAVLFLGVLPI